MAGDPAAVARRQRILIIDDDPMIASVVRRILREYEVQIVSGAVEAIALLHANAQFDLIFCDMNMPEVSGAEFYARVAESWPEHVSRIVFLTGDADHASIRKLTSVPHLPKPFEVSELRSLVASRLG